MVGEPDRVVLRHDENAGSEPHPFGDRGRPRQRDERIEQERRRIALFGWMHDVVADPDVGEAELLRMPGGPDDRVAARDPAVLWQVDPVRDGHPASMHP